MISNILTHVLMAMFLCLSFKFIMSDKVKTKGETMSNVYPNAGVYNQSFKLPHNGNFISDSELVNPSHDVLDPVYVNKERGGSNKAARYVNWETNNRKNVEDPERINDKNLCSNMLLPYKNKFEVGCNIDADCGGGRNRCNATTNECECVDGAGKFCEKGKRHYPDPLNMTPQQVIKYKQTYHPNMTKQD